MTYYIVSYISAVTGNHCTSASKTLKDARKEVKALEKEGAKDVKIIGLKKEHK